jgi:cytochrome P450
VPNIISRVHLNDTPWRGDGEHEPHGPRRRRGFAYAEAQVLLAALLCEFDMSLVEGHTPQEVDRVVLTSANGLPRPIRKK